MTDPPESMGVSKGNVSQRRAQSVINKVEEVYSATSGWNDDGYKDRACNVVVTLNKQMSACLRESE